MEELDLKELIAMFLEKKLLIILVVIIFALIGAIYTLNFITPIYKSSTTLILAQAGLNALKGETNSITASDISLNANLVKNYKEIAESRIVAKRVIENLGLEESIEMIQANTVVSTSSDTEVLKITVSNVDPELACKIANEIAKVFTERALEIYKVDNVNVLDEAVVSLKPSNINLVKNIIVFAFSGGILVIGYILLVNMLDTTVKTDIDIERALKLPVLASITLTDDTPKKKKSKNSRKKSSRASAFDTDFEAKILGSSQDPSNVSRENTTTDESISMFSYMYKDKENIENSEDRSSTHPKTLSNSKTIADEKKNKRKDDRK